MESKIVAIAAYNTEKQELIGIFASQTLAAKYLLPHELQDSKPRVNYAAANKKRLKESIFEFKVALRYATTAQIEMLKGETHLITDGYPLAQKNKMKGWTDTKGTMRDAAVLLAGRITKEVQNKRKEQSLM